MMELILLRVHPELAARAADWFSEKWGIPRSAYEQSMAACLSGSRAVPQWYLAMEDGRIVGGMGVIDNDFHHRPDLRPNVCAVFTEPAFRGCGIAGRLLALVCRDMHKLGAHTLYLLTDHTGFYERYGWSYLFPVLGDGEQTPSRMYMHLSSWEDQP